MGVLERGDDLDRRTRPEHVRVGRPEHQPDAAPPQSPQTAAVMADAATRLLAALTDAQRDRVSFEFADEGRRRDWSFLPVPERDGLPIGALDNDQRKLAHALVAAGTSVPGYVKVVSVMAMEHVLRALAEASRPAAAHLFDPGQAWSAPAVS